MGPAHVNRILIGFDHFEINALMLMSVFISNNGATGFQLRTRQRMFSSKGEEKNDPADDWTVERGTNYPLASNHDLFGEVPPQTKPNKRKPVVEGVPALWTAQKSTLICEYLHLFLLLTKSGVYIDLFAGPQKEEYTEDWTIKRVIERRTIGPNFKYFAACDLKPKQVARLRRLKDEHEEQSFKFKIYEGDANDQIDGILRDAPISVKVPCFCLIDQRTLECDWETVRKISEFKKEGFKIEVLYFLAESWFNRSWKSRKDGERARSWWGRDDYMEFLDQRSVDRAHGMCSRFHEELGYEYAEPWAIYKHGTTGRTMYYLIHASDHRDARRLMSEAYVETPRVGLKLATQGEMFQR